tara:strand:+ start:2659 stop:3015 length:357 start_codon:yes stop_codon:yes gene_type:complete
MEKTHYEKYICNRFLVSHDPDGGIECEDTELRGTVFRLRDKDVIADGVVYLEEDEVIFHPPKCGIEPFRLKWGGEEEYSEEESEEEDHFEKASRYKKSYTDKDDIVLIEMSSSKKRKR